MQDPDLPVGATRAGQIRAYAGPPVTGDAAEPWRDRPPWRDHPHRIVVGGQSARNADSAAGTFLPNR